MARTKTLRDLKEVDEQELIREYWDSLEETLRAEEERPYAALRS